MRRLANGHLVGRFVVVAEDAQFPFEIFGHGLPLEPVGEVFELQRTPVVGCVG